MTRGANPMARWNAATEQLVRARPEKPSSGAEAKGGTLRSSRRARALRRSSSLELARVVDVDGEETFVDVSSLSIRHRRARTIVGNENLRTGDEVLVALVGEEAADVVIVGRIHDPNAPPRDVSVNGRR